MLDDRRFLELIGAAPLVAVDLVIRNGRGQALLGKRSNRPARGHWFVPGGRIRKNERIAAAMKRVSKAELGVEIEAGELIGAFDHLYPDNTFAAEGITTHYVALGYACALSDKAQLIVDSQHSELRWWDVRELLASDEVHENTKAYFRASGRRP